MDKPAQAPAAGDRSATRKKLPRTVIVLGLVSFFNDFASDIVIPLIPILLATIFAPGPVALGFIEGVADAIAMPQQPPRRSGQPTESLRQIPDE